VRGLTLLSRFLKKRAGAARPKAEANLIRPAIIFPTVFGLVRKRDENTQ
jgi:hypothetical protein